MMTHRIPWLTLAAVLATAVPTMAQQKFDIVLKKPAKGENLQVEKSDAEDTKVHLVDANGQVQNDLSQGKKVTNFTYRQTILVQGENDRPPTKLQRHYTKAEVVSANMNTTLPYQGKTVLIEKKEDKYRFDIEGGAELTGKDAAELDREFNKKNPGGPDFEKMMLPGRPVAVGDSWNVDTAPLIADLKRSGDIVPDADKFKVTVKLTRAYKKDGRQFGVLHLDMVMPIKAIGDKGKVNAVKPGALMRMIADLDVCIDGSSSIGTLKGQINADMTLPIPEQPGMSVVVRSRNDLFEQRTLPNK